MYVDDVNVLSGILYSIKKNNKFRFRYAECLTTKLQLNLENIEETEVSKVQTNRVNCPLFEVHKNWQIIRKIRNFVSDMIDELN